MNIPNQLTVARMVTIFIFLILANFQPNAYLSVDMVQIIHIIAFVLAILAGLTDFFDGYLARKYNQVTEFGKLMDPLADKVFVAATIIMFVEFGLMPAWIAVIVISREFLVTGLRLLAVQKGTVISAGIWGKLKTMLQMCMLFLAGASWVGMFNLQQGVFFGIKLWSVWIVFLWVIAIFTVLSGLSYFVKYRYLYLDSTSHSNK